MDTITVASTEKLENVVASSGDFVANGNLIFSAKNGFLQKLLVRAEEKYNGEGWNSLGINFSSSFIEFKKTHSHFS